MWAHTERVDDLDDLTPWPVQMRHQKARELRLLRVIERQQRGGEPTASALAAAEDFARMLRETGQVVGYSPTRGFLVVLAAPDDAGLIRRELLP